MPTLIGTGISKNASSLEAGKEAAAQSVAALSGKPPNIVITFASVRYEPETLMKGIAETAPSAMIIGCTTAGEILPGGPHKKSVVAMSIYSDEIEFFAAAEEDASVDPYLNAQRLAKTISAKKPRNPRLLLMLFDGLKTNSEELTRGVQSIFGTGFPVIGAASGDDFLYKTPYQFLNGRALQNAAVGVMMSGNIKVGIGIRHGWSPLSKPQMVDLSSGNIVFQIAGKPAIEFYKDYFGETFVEQNLDLLPKITIEYPLGISAPCEERYILRNLLEIMPNNGLRYAGNITQGEAIRLMKGTKETALRAAQQAVKHALESSNVEKVDFALVFDSASRQILLGRYAREEINIIAKTLGADVPFIGFYDYGEQAPISTDVYLGRAHAHNESIAVTVIGK